MAVNIVALELLDYGVTPVSEHVWVRGLSKGFSVLVQSDYEGWGKPRRLYSSKKHYSWRALARCLPTLSNDDRTNPYEEAAPHVVVKGEEGLIAELLRYAYASGDGGMPDYVALLIDQTDDCLSRVAKITDGRLSTEVIQQLLDIEDGIRTLHLTRDLCTLCRETAGFHDLDLKALSEHLKRLLDIQRRKEAELRGATIAPFRQKIEAMVEKFDDKSVRGGGMVMPSKRMRVRRFLESYVISHGTLPSGPTHVKSDSKHFSWDFGIINFDEA